MEDYAIVIGIDNYPELPKLTSTRKDVASFAEWLRSPVGGNITDESHIRTIVSPENQLPDFFDAKPVKREIDKALSDFGIGNGHILGRRLYFYFSGHGIGVSPTEVSMLMANASEDFLNRNIGLNAYLSLFEKKELFREVVFFIDCCRDEFSRQIVAQNSDFTLEDDPIPPDPNQFVFLASAHGKKSFSVPNSQGFMTQALIEGLNGKATDSMGRVTASSLTNWVPARVKELARDNRVKQIPRVARPQRNEIVFCVIKDAENIEDVTDSDNKVTVKIYTSGNIGGNLILFDGNFKEIGRQATDEINNDKPWEVSLLDTDVPYLLKNDETDLLKMIEINKIKGENYEFRFSLA